MHRVKKLSALIPLFLGMILAGCDQHYYVKPFDMTAYFYLSYNLEDEFQMQRTVDDSIIDTLNFRVKTKEIVVEKSHFIGDYITESFYFSASTADNNYFFGSYGNQDGVYGYFNGIGFSFIEIILPNIELNGNSFQGVFVHKTESGPILTLLNNIEHGIIQVKTDSLTLTKISEE
jgi:hypothetical protein